MNLATIRCQSIDALEQSDRVMWTQCRSVVFSYIRIVPQLRYSGLKGRLFKGSGVDPCGTVTRALTSGLSVSITMVPEIASHWSDCIRPSLDVLPVLNAVDLAASSVQLCGVAYSIVYTYVERKKWIG